VEIQAKRESSGANLSYDSDPGRDLGPTVAFSQTENLIHIRITFQQLAKAGLNHNGNAEVRPPLFEQPDYWSEQHNVADRAQAD
jgi:hypothetical protein